MTESLRMRIRVAVAVILGAVSPCLATSQTSDSKNEPVKCGFQGIRRKDGWTIPGIEKAKTRYRAAFKNLPGVFVIKLDPSQPETTIRRIFCSRDGPGRLEIDDLPIRILDLTAYEFNGRIFAYGVSYELQAIQNGVRYALGAASADLFYDVDGSGRFTVRKSAQWPFLPDPPPDWTRHLNDLR